jgi:RHS repeat-associated protein
MRAGVNWVSCAVVAINRALRNFLPTSSTRVLLRFVVAATLIVAGAFAGSDGLTGARKASAQTTGTLGWYTVLLPTGTGGYFSTAMAACRAQFDAYAWPNATFNGPKDSLHWYTKSCEWTRHGGGPLGGTVTFYCATGYAALPSGVCIDQNLNVEMRITEDSAGRSCGQGTPSVGTQNKGGNASGSTSHPIDLMTGAKTFRFRDFETADGALVLERVYNSLSYAAEPAVMKRLPWGIGNGWRFTFQHEIHLYTSAYAALATAEGGAYGFKRDNTTGAWLADNYGNTIRRQTDYELAFVGTYPASWSTVVAAPSQWSMRDAQDRVWLFQTYLNASTGKYDIGLPTSVTFRGGLQWTFTYGSLNQLTSITDSYGKVISFTWYTYDGGGGIPVLLNGIASATVPDGTTYKYILDAVAPSTGEYDRLVKVEHRDAANTLLESTEYLHENTALFYHVTGIKDRDGVRRWTVEYEATGRAITSTGPNDVDKYTVAYGAIASNTSTRTVTNPLGKQSVLTYTWNTSGSGGGKDFHLNKIDGTASANCAASTQTYTVDSTTKFITSVTDAEGRVTNYTRNANGQPTQVIDGYETPSARTTGMTWHTTLNMPTQLVQPGLQTDFTWNSLGQLTQVTQLDTTSQSSPYATAGQVRAWTYTYDSFGHLLTADGPLSGPGDTVIYGYNAAGYLTSITNEVGHVTSIAALNGRGQPTTIVDPNGVTSNLTYDAEGRLTSVTADPGGIAAVSSFEYNAVGDVTKVTRPNGAYLLYTRDDGRRITKVEDNTGASIEYDRNNLGNVTARRIKDASSSVVLAQTATFDELGRLLAFVGASSQTWTHAWDKTDNLKTVTDPRSNTFSRLFDPLNRLVRETDEGGGQVNLSRNGKDEIVNYNDPRALNTSYVRNGFGDIIQQTSPDSGVTVTYYNNLGLPTQVIDGRGVVTNLTYDNAGRILTKQFPASTSENVTYAYDSTASGNKGVGRLTNVSDADGSVAWFYDALGRKLQEARTTGASLYGSNFSYDADGNIAQVVYPTGHIVNYARDVLGRITGVSWKANAGATPVPIVTDVGYQPFGPIQSVWFGNGLDQWKTFDQDYRLTRILVEDVSTSTTYMSRWFNYADNLNLTQIDDTFHPSRTENYWYTAAGRLQNADGPWGSFTWYYDGTGNRTQEILTQGATTTSVFGYPATDNRVSSVTVGGSPVRSFTYDGAGNITQDARAPATQDYTYNARGRLASASVGGSPAADYSYDALERLTLRTFHGMSGPVTTQFAYDLSGRVLAEVAATAREYIWLDDMPVAMIDDAAGTPQILFLHTDQLDRPVMMTTAAKAVVYDAVFRPFGEVETLATGTTTVNLRFPGQYQLAETGVAHNWHRTYDASLGRYLQPDPLGFVDGPSVYAYAKSSPGVYVDPKGLQEALPRPGLGIPIYPKPFNEWNRRGNQGLWDAFLKLCRRMAGGFGGGRNDGDDTCEKQVTADEAICRTLPQAGARSRCFESANARYGACRNNNPLPQLITW